MKISIVMACYNAEETLEPQLRALINQSWNQPWEIIIADNRCTDNSMAIVKEYQKKAPNLRIVDASERQGQPFALNCGIEAAKGISIILCDADDVAGDGWLAALGEALEEEDFVACCCEIETLNSELALGRGEMQADGLQNIWYPPYLPHAAGSTLAFKKALFTKIGGFDESLPYLHDTDFCFKAQMLGVKIRFVRNAIMHIRYRDTFKGMYRQSKNYAEYNVLLAKRYNPDGKIGKTTGLQYFRGWWKIGKKFPLRGDQKAWGNLAWLIGRQMGRLTGAIKFHAPPV